MAQMVATEVGQNAIAPPAGATPDGENDLIFQDIPPFPDDVPIAPLLRISLKLLLDNDAEEVERFWRTSCDVGFFYLDCRAAVDTSKHDSAHDLPGTATKEGKVDGDGLLRDAAAMHEFGPKVFQLPLQEKTKYDYTDLDTFFGYKGYGRGVVDSKGTPDRSELWNVSKDDIFGLSGRLPNPDMLQDESNRELIKSFMTRSQAVVLLLLRLLNDRLGLPPETLQNLHRVQQCSGDHLRWITAPPQPMNDRQMSTAEHTDFGSLTLLFNKMGGLEILMPNADEWCYVKPLKGHCVCNLGDSLVKFTAGILRSNIHRVVNPPGEQANSTRMSVVYFSRPEDDVIFKVLDGSERIDARRKEQGEAGEEEQVTSKDWTLRRAKGKRVGGDWHSTLGTEGNRMSK